MYDKCVNVVDIMFPLIVVCCCNRKVTERNDRAIDDVLITLVQILQAQ